MSSRALPAALLPILLVCAAQRSDAGPGENPQANVGMKKLLGSREQQVDLKGNGKAIVHRRFDAAGRLNEVSFIDYSVEPPLTERLTIDRATPTASETRVRTTEKGKTVVRREVERYARNGDLTEREIVWSDKGDGNLNRRVVLAYHELDVKVVNYELEGKDWKPTKDQSGSPKPPPRR